MRAKTKLFVAIIFFATIPLIILNIFLSLRISKENEDIFRSVISQNTKIRAQNLSVLFDEDLNRAKEIASIDYVKKLVEESNKLSWAEFSSSGFQMAELVKKDLEDVQRFNSNVEKAMLINNEGKIIVSSADDEGEILKNKDFLFSIADKYNGISFDILNSNASENPVYYVAKFVYSDENKLQGIFVQICNTKAIQNILNFSKTSSSYFLILDLKGNIFEYPYTSLVNFSENPSYEELKDFFKNSLTLGGQQVAGSFKKFRNHNNFNYTAYNCSIANANMTLVSITSGSSSYYDALEPMLVGFRILSAVLVAILFAAVFLFSDKFTKPIDNMVDVLIKKYHGDSSVKFSVFSNDEFGKIATAFNSIFESLSETDQRYRTIVEMTDNIVFEINFRKNTVFMSENFNQKFSFRPQSDALQDSFFYRGRIHKDDRERFLADFEKILNSCSEMQGEYRFKNIYGDFAWMLIRCKKIFDSKNSPVKIIGVIVDIDREKRNQMNLLQKASYDALTQLYNRETFMKTLANEFELSLMRKTLLALMFIDLDDFKHFNDDYGHACGDEVLKYVAESIREIVSDQGFAGRYGGDEFVVCLNNIKYFDDAGKIAEKIISVLSKGFVSELLDQKFSVHCSIGIAFFNENGKNCEEVIYAADEAMYSVKKHGKSNYAYAVINKNQMD